MTTIIDTHAHIDLPDFDEDRESVMQRAAAAGVAAIIAIGFNPERWRATAALTDMYPNVRRAVGVHPNNASSWNVEVADALRRELATSDVVAVGEIGLDFYREHASAADQRRCFIDQLQIAVDARLPIVIHQRQAENDLLDILRPYAPLNGVLHCFSGDEGFAEACLELGLHFGAGGVMTYPKSEAVRRALKAVPASKLLLETDAPYLAPQGRRGQRNEPAFARLVAERLASEREMTFDELAEVTSGNAVALFGQGLATALEQRIGDHA